MCHEWFSSASSAKSTLPRSDFVHGVLGVLKLEQDGDADNVNTTVMQGGAWRCFIHMFTYLLTRNIDPDAVPLQSLGVVDVAANDVNDNEVLAHALANVSRAEKGAAFAVRRGGTHVNEYPHRNPDGSLTDGSGDNPSHLLGSFPCLFPYG